MNILVVGGGGREHAVCWALRRSARCGGLWCAPGNAGIASVAACLPDVGAEDLDGILSACATHAIDLVVVGPEAPLVAGLVDRLEAAGIAAVGPSAAAAQLEGSKAFMKAVLDRAGVPTARFQAFTDAEAAKAYVMETGAPLVVKADGLAAGKGVLMCETESEALAAVDAMLSEGAFGAAGAAIVIEEWLRGEEASVFALCDGTTAVSLGAAQDHKRVGEGDTGPNTGGMGAYAPAPVVDPAMELRIMTEIVQPTIDAMAAAGTPFKGILFAGLMIDDAGPKVLEFNVRFGDPECQALMVRLDGDLLDLLEAAAHGRLEDGPLPRWRDEAALVVVMAADGYPGAYQKGSVIGGLDAAGAVDGVTVFHAGTKAGPDGAVLAAGGRVLGVTALGASVAEAQARAHAAIDRLDWPEGFCRRDIGWRAIAREGGPR
ncbi:phosphoribosylamine--glycine ligase [Roseospira marina]|uniref:Phosphoribosylamine--glycine ligase n=1 Tax=Roseospira marina TaxID=140057 RepID=A0A5M6IBU4_9PROT|nr:phosphoribosylamine--glycine ligase [Roseospira marina]KAA5605088.1 phosphoribosylamine--glycine ligase [Roseospira marina]MBB4314835.1 phosphoribosylamine--glycine ligase [Roseospira marina]MBB5087835.1 phosphoribosylamine--glycine ligase [Roseospira marina]